MNNLSDNDSNKGVDKTLDLTSLSFFNSDPYFNFVYKKSERLCMAIYLITDFFPVKDSIKDNMRKAGTDLIKISLSLITASSSYRKDILNDISRICLEVVSLSKVASNLGMTSLPNHNVLESEIKNFIGVIEEREMPSTTGQGFVLNEEILGTRTCDISDITQIARQDPLPQSYTSKSYYHVEEKTEVKMNTQVGDSSGLDKKVVQVKDLSKPQDVSKHGNVVKTQNNLGSTGSGTNTVVGTKSVMQKNERQQIILDIIKEIGESSIKDISDNIKDCSEKTIQRELNTLIYDGVLKKIGERRWSKYVLA